MDIYQRPLTPPTDHAKDHIMATTIPTANGGITTIPVTEKDDINDQSFLQKEQEAINNNRTSMSSLDTKNSDNSHTSHGLPLSDLYNSTTTAAPSAPFDTSYETKAPTSDYNTADTTTATAPSSMYNTGDNIFDMNHSTTGPTSTFNMDEVHKTNDNSFSMSPPSTAPAANSSVSNPFTSMRENNTTTAASIPATRKLSQMDQENTNTTRNTAHSFGNDHSGTTAKKYRGYERNETTHRIESEVLSILQWRNPIRSGVMFASIVGSIVLTRWYSLLQIGSSLLTLAIGINLIYVNLLVQSQKVLTNHEASHPYSDVIDNNENHTMIDQRSVRRYSTVLSELSETVIRALTRIIFVENTLTSLKWMAIFFAIWKVSAIFSTMDIVLMVVISAFTFPRLYISNKDVVDAQLQKGQTLLQTGINKAHSAATENAQNTYVKARAYVAQVGTTGTDAKNTLAKQSVTVKDENEL